MPRKNHPKRSELPRRHHNTKGYRQIKTGASFRRLVMFARKLGLRVEGEGEVEQLRRRERPTNETHKTHTSNNNKRRT